MAAKKGGKKKGYYERQRAKTIINKNRRAATRKKKLEKWVKRGTNKKGKVVLDVAQRKQRAEVRKATREQIKQEERRTAHIRRVTGDRAVEVYNREQSLKPEAHAAK